MGIVIAFRPRSGPWLPTERAALVAIERALERHGFLIYWQQGIAASNSPWRAFYDTMTSQLVVHISRSKGNYALVWADGTSVKVERMDKLVEMARPWIVRSHGAPSLPLTVPGVLPS